MSVVKVSVWLLVIVIAGGQLGGLVQDALLQAGLLSKPIDWKEACNLKILPAWFRKYLNCPKNNEKKEEKPKLSLGGDLFQKFKFETRKKTVIEKLTDGINNAFVYAQRLVLPEKFVMPCLLGDCDMDKQIKKQKEEYSNLMRKTVSVQPPQEIPKKKRMEDSSASEKASEDSNPDPNLVEPTEKFES